MELGHVIPLAIFVIVGMVISWRLLRGRRAPSVTAGAAAAGGAPPPVPPIPGTFKKGLGRVFNLGFFTLYGLVLGVMVLMLIWLGDYLAYIGDLYQTVAVSMVVVGAFMLLITKGKFWSLVAMITVFGFLAFTSPVQLANTLNLAQAEGDGVPLPNLGIDFGGGNNEVRYASPYLARPLGALEPIVLGPGQVSVEFVGYTGSTFCWQAGLPETLVREVKLQDGSWIPRTEYVGRIHGPLSATRWRNDGGEIVEIHGRRAVACN